ncbi:hypothetical protein ACFQ4C_12075 [Larkinella insperata]|uniref:Uncharacterized protein n=1 Tax=Larkinella insperata TaxID=332158 RepID=A0ABW3QIV4_9BACT|nr:hypothetical protein [Larkinella insperata]
MAKILIGYADIKNEPRVGVFFPHSLENAVLLFRYDTPDQVPALAAASNFILDQMGVTNREVKRFPNINMVIVYKK